MKKPSIQFYPGDWRKEPTVSCLSLAAKGLWWEMLLLMNEAPRRGFLDITVEMLARSAGSTPREVQKLLTEMERAGTYSRQDECIVNRRMLREQGISVERSKAGGKGAANRWQNGSKPHDKSSEVAIRLAIPRAGAVEAEAEEEKEELRNNFLAFVELWKIPCECCGAVFGCKDVDLASRQWVCLVDRGAITPHNYQAVLDGLKRWKLSLDWHKNNAQYVPSVAVWLGWSKEGRPSEPRWNDYPRPFKTKSGEGY